MGDNKNTEKRRKKKIYVTEEQKKKAQQGWAKNYDAKFEKFLVRLPQGTRDKITKLGYQSGNSFIQEAVKNEFERGSSSLEQFIKISPDELEKRIAHLGYTDLSVFISEAIEEKLENEEAINPPINSKTMYSLEEVLKEGIIREKKDLKEDHEL